MANVWKVEKVEYYTRILSRPNRHGQTQTAGRKKVIYWDGKTKGGRLVQGMATRRAALAAIAALETVENAGLSLPPGWTEAEPGGLACNPDPLDGGIIDKGIASGLWFVIFNRRDLGDLEGYSTRAEAFDAFAQTIRAAGDAP